MAQVKSLEIELGEVGETQQGPRLSSESFLPGSTAPFEAPPAVTRPSKKAGMPFAVANFLNSIVGAGIIGMPYALYHCGMVTGLILLMYVGYLTDQSVRMIVEMGRDLDVFDYEKLAEKVFGRRGYVAITVFMFLLAFGAMVAYMVIIGDVVPEILGIEVTGASRALSIILCSGMVMLPLSILKDMSALAFTSFASVAADFVLVLIIMACSPVQESLASNGGFFSVAGSSIIRPSTVFSGLGAMSFAFVCHHSSFIVADSLTDSTTERWAKVTHISVGSAFTMCFFLGLFGYLGFLDDTEGDILNNFIGTDTAYATITAGRVMLALTMFFTYPMESFVARHCVVSLKWGEGVANDIPRNKRIGVTVALYLVALFIALVFQDLGIVLELTGAVSGSFLSYILPSSLYMCVHSKELLSILQQIGLGSSPFCFCCVRLSEMSVLNSSNQSGEASGGNSSDEDAPVEISLADEEGSSFLARARHKLMLLRPFWLSLSMFVFGVIAFVVGSTTTILAAAGVGGE